MTYRARGRTIFEVILAICFVGFLVGFITVLCIGNYFRAKRAQERQRQRRLAKISSSSSNPSRAARTPSSAGSRVGLTGGSEASYPVSETPSNMGGYEAPHLPSSNPSAPRN